MSKLKVTRDQLSKFIEDNNTVTQFERIFKLIGSLEESAGGLAPIPVIARTDISTDYEYTTTAQYMSYLVIDSLSADITITVTDGGFDERSRFKVLNNDPTYKIIMTDGTLTFWVEPGQVVDFYLKGTTLMWASAGWELMWTGSQLTNLNETALTRLVIDADKQVYELNGLTSGKSYSFSIRTVSSSTRCDSMYSSVSSRFSWNSSSNRSFGPVNLTMKDIRLWHDAA